MADPLRELRRGEVVWAESDLTGPLTIDLDSIVEVHGRTKQGAAFHQTRTTSHEVLARQQLISADTDFGTQLQAG